MLQKEKKTQLLRGKGRKKWMIHPGLRRDSMQVLLLGLGKTFLMLQRDGNFSTVTVCNGNLSFGRNGVFAFYSDNLGSYFYKFLKYLF